MARGKKKETLTPEERLQAALVPESEQPYKVPRNWCWMRGRAFLKPMETKRPEGEVFRYIDIDSIDNKRQQVTEPKNLQVKDAPSRASRKLRTGDTVFSMVRPYLMNIAYIDETISNSIASTGFYVCTPTENVNSLYLYYLMTSPYTVDGLNRYMKGDNSPSIRKDDIENYVYPIPPLPEQQRIVNRIESLFAKLDEAKQKAQDALDSFEPRKAAILHSAFTGELTARWRKERGIGMDSWERLKLGEIGTLERGRSQHRPRNDPRLFGGPYPFIQTGDVASANVYITEHHQTLSEFGMEQSRMFSAETLCITIAANIGDVAILSYDCCFPDSVVGFIPNNRSISKFVYYMMSVLQKELEDNAPATAQKNINLKILNAVEMNIPPVIEQAEIVRRLDNLLAKEQQAKEAAEGVLEQIDLIKKAILARAFRGELGTNDPSEESAQELIKNFIFKM